VWIIQILWASMRIGFNTWISHLWNIWEIVFSCAYLHTHFYCIFLCLSICQKRMLITPTLKDYCNIKYPGPSLWLENVTNPRITILQLSRNLSLTRSCWTCGELLPRVWVGIRARLSWGCQLVAYLCSWDGKREKKLPWLCLSGWRSGRVDDIS
jgi:hypothetical protein